MKKEWSRYIVSAGIVSLMLAAAAHAQKTPQNQEADSRFSARKKELLNNIGEHIARMQKKQACISDAADEKALKGCFSGGNAGGHADVK